MRKKFSEKYNFKSPRESFQINSIDEGLRNRIWNQIQSFYFDKIERNGINIQYQRDYNFFIQLYDEFFKSHEKVDVYLNGINRDLKNRYYKLEWFEIYDLIEYMSEIYCLEEVNVEFRSQVNKVLEDEMSAYRFVNEYIAPIIDDVEIDEIEEAMDCEHAGVKIHLSNALEHLSDRENPDFVNSIKESISAVESALNLISGKTNVALNRAINDLPFEIDKNLKAGIIKIYSWTSSADGIRHAVTEEEIKSSFAEAKYMLVSCSAFVNYLFEKQKEIEI